MSIISLIIALMGTTILSGLGLEQALESAGPNRMVLEEALERTPVDQRQGMIWLITHMPEEDRRQLTAEYLLENTAVAHETWESVPWRDDVPQEIFLDSVLPYASINERRDDWRRSFHEQFAPLVAEARTPSEAAAILNNKVFPMVGVKYSTQRPKADQSAMESIEAGLASCTGLSVLLIDACRSVGVPARFVGTPLWSDGSGNHSWVEIYDDGKWHFTGAAEPSGMELNRGWFAGRASGAMEGDPRRAIFAVTWRKVPLHFPLVWKPEDTSVGAVDVTRRYAKDEPAVREGEARLRLRAMGRNSRRLATPITVHDSQGVLLFEGTTRDERFDANDHLEVLLPIGSEVKVTSEAGVRTVVVRADEQLETLDMVPRGSFPPGDQPLTRSQSEAMQARLIGAWKARETPIRRRELDSGVLSHADVKMPIFYSTHGEAPEGGRSLYISMHGGGGAPPEVNDRQWKNQQRLYELDEGIYVAPRAPSDTWNLWHQGHVDPLFDRLITNMILAEDVDPDRVYLTGYSAGGDGVYQLAPRMADRFGAAAMMAGHPNETSHEGLRNLPMAIHVGENDSPYGRNRVAGQWKERLAKARAEDSDGYEHVVELHAGKGHWMDGDDGKALPWMAQFKRRTRPERIVWKQDDVTHDRFYWLKVEAPVGRDRVVVERDGQIFTVLEPGAAKTLTIRLDDTMMDLDLPVLVKDVEGGVLFEGHVSRTREVLERTLAERGDPHGVYSAEVTVKVGE